MGALAMGSGAAFTSAALQNTAEASADFRVLVEDELIVRPGDSFRDGNGDFDPGNNAGEGFGSYDREDDNLFENGGLDGIDEDDVPAAAMNDAENDELEIDVVTALNQRDTFEEFLEVTNEGETVREVGIGFEEFGSDVDEEDEGPTEDDVVGIYRFERDDFQISVDDDDEFPNYLTLEPGQSRQIDLVVDTTDTDIRNRILEVAETDGNPFDDGGTLGTVDLVETIKFGTEEDDPADQDEEIDD